MLKILLLTFLLLPLTWVTADALTLQNAFIDKMEKEYNFDRQSLGNLLAQAVVSEKILAAISKPAEKKLRWYQYRKIFIQKKRINGGIKFWQDNKNILQQAETEFGIPAEIIVAIIGVETFYGQRSGGYRVIDALNTLSFHYPKRSAFFKKELEQFLLLTRDQEFNPLTLTGSYAGAMGIPQFISSSYRHYAIDYDGDKVADIWNSPSDAIGSVANYLAKHGWQHNRPVINKVTVQGNNYKSVLNNGLKLDIVGAAIKNLGIVSRLDFKDNEPLKLFEYQLENTNEYWLAHKNFYVITRYNHSKLYAMAVYQLANEIKSNMP